MEAGRIHVSHGLPHAGFHRQREHAEEWGTQLRWYGIAAVVGFVVPYLGSSVLGLQHDVYLGIYFASVVALFGSYAVSTDLDLRAAFTRHWRLGVAIGIVVAFALVRNVLSEQRTPHPGGVYLAFEIFWRGELYGAVDALLLTVLPCLIVYRALGSRLATWRRRFGYLGASLALVLLMTAIYHLGYAQYRSDGVRQPETGNTLISIPMLLTVNPIGSIADHMAMHVAAVAHTYETDVRLPPPAKAK